jgi:hypothetical protein
MNHTEIVVHGLGPPERRRAAHLVGPLARPPRLPHRTLKLANEPEERLSIQQIVRDRVGKWRIGTPRDRFVIAAFSVGNNECMCDLIEVAHGVTGSADRGSLKPLLISQCRNRVEPCRPPRR